MTDLPGRAQHFHAPTPPQWRGFLKVESCSESPLLRGGAAAFCAAGEVCHLMQQPEVVLTNGKIYAGADFSTIVDSVCVRSGRIAEIGNSQSYDQGSEVIDLRGRTVCCRDSSIPTPISANTG